jgi:hypothetical protein
MQRSHLQLALVLAIATFGATGVQAADSPLDYQYFKTRVEPIFMKKRPDHARCIVCHTDNNSAFRLEKPENDKGWSEAASRKNFQQVSALVTPGSPDKSHLLNYPLAPEAGGSIYHSGGRQFASKEDPDWKTIAAWVNGAKAGAAGNAK